MSIVLSRDPSYSLHCTSVTGHESATSIHHVITGEQVNESTYTRMKLQSRLKK